MSEPVDSDNPTPGLNLPVMVSDHDDSSTLPSSKSYADWAASCPEVYLDFGESIGLARAKLCPFCGNPKRLGQGSNQSLIEHMKSRSCIAIQRKLESEIQDIPASEEMGHEPGPGTSNSNTQLLTPAPSFVLYNTYINPLACQGAEVKTSVPIWANYPWHLHDPSFNLPKPLLFTICSQNRTGDAIRIRSHFCVGVVPDLQYGSCNPCIEAADSREVKSIIKRAETETPVNGLNLKYYSHKQVCTLVEGLQETLKKYRLHGIEVNRKAARLLGKLTDHKQLMFALAEVDDIAVSRIVQVALRQGCGPNAIVERLKNAQEGLYRCEKYSEKQIDIALLSLRLGGPRLLYALHKSLSLPSISTVNRHAERAYMRPSIATPTKDEVMANIKSMCGHAKSVVPLTGLRGFSVLIDEIALEERIRYSTPEDALVGFARETISPEQVQNMTGRPISHLFALKRLLDSGECQLATEATVVAIAPFGPTNYTPMVIAMSGTCKTETVDGQLSLLKTVYQAYNESPHGAAALGPIWSFATDGDARRRLALYRLCMTHTLSPPSPLYLELYRLDLMNLACGENNVTHDGDFKHEEKRFASALRSSVGVAVNGTHIPASFVKHTLRLVPTLTPDRLESLFDNSDRQSVPKAHTLLKGIYDASQLPDIRKQPGLKSFVLLGELLHAFYAPHTTPSMSLSQQVVSLAKCAFMLFALYRLDGPRFITSQLYYDIQASIKNIIFCIAKTQLLDPMRPFYIIHTGDDCLENLFGIYRTTSTNRNPDLYQLSDRASNAQEVDNILAKYPNYDRKPYRLSVEGMSGVDHLNPASWTGDVCVANVNLWASWSAGRDKAAVALRQAGIKLNFDPKSLRDSAEGLTVDLMRPWGHYVGVNESIPTEEDPDPLASVPNTMPVDLDTGPAMHNNLADNSNPNPALDPIFDPLSHEDTELLLEEGLPALMPPGMSENEEIQTPIGAIKRGWVEMDSHWVHLESAARLVFGTESTEKSADRLCRVLALDYENGNWYWDHSYITSSNGLNNKRTSTINNKPLLVKFHAHTIELVNPNLVDRFGVPSWAFEHQDLMATIDLLWSKSSESLQNIPVHSGLVGFPYHCERVAGKQALIHHNASQALEDLPAEQCGACHVCGHLVPIKQYMRTHIAKHILMRKAGTGLPSQDNMLGHAPCGFCGRSGIPKCKTTLNRSKKSTTVKSGCQYFDKFSYKPAETSTVSSPCTNRPICCEFPGCSKTDPIWSYNMRDHILAVHGQDLYNRVLNEGQFMVSSEEIGYLQLDKPLVIPGRRMITLPSAPLHGIKRPIEDLAAIQTSSTSSEGHLQDFTHVDTETDPVASGSAPKRARGA
ncbi:unnamed protein product [Rhizoctonia solani]|uniref:Uncharacterized protein n=1 Tax=Rhizoctonia solani TaxID=456999 RepID=A0A8H3D6X9_9AGAM|nr:unnamed protein product [Rhizoctonia solani]